VRDVRTFVEDTYDWLLTHRETLASILSE